jgi:hypothetical protein
MVPMHRKGKVSEARWIGNWNNMGKYGRKRERERERMSFFLVLFNRKERNEVKWRRSGSILF